MMPLVHPNARLAKPSQPPTTFSPLPHFPGSSVLTLSPDGQDRHGYQRTKHTSQVSPWIPISSYLGLTQRLREILADGLYSHQTLKSATAAPQDEVS